MILAGVEPTPAIAFLVTDLGASSGVVISASHNPPEYNGIKFFAGNGMKLPDALEDEIEALVTAPAAPAAVGGTTLPSGDARHRYLDHLVSAAEAPLDGMTLVVDCANGAASELAPALLRRLGATVHAINAAPDGLNINHRCGALYPEVVAAEVVRRGADAGVTHDGDADRVLFVGRGGPHRGRRPGAGRARRGDARARGGSWATSSSPRSWRTSAFTTRCATPGSRSWRPRWGTATSWRTCCAPGRCWAASSRAT